VKGPVSIYEISLLSVTLLLMVISISSLIKSRSVHAKFDQIIGAHNAMIDEMDTLERNQKELIEKYNELHGAYEYLDERYELHTQGHR